MKVSKVQLDILQKMNDGWELGFYQGFNASCRLQEGGIGRGGKVQTVNTNTYYSLRREGLIVISKEDYPTDKYAIGEKGKALVLEEA